MTDTGDGGEVSHALHTVPWPALEPIAGFVSLMGTRNAQPESGTERGCLSDLGHPGVHSLTHRGFILVPGVS